MIRLLNVLGICVLSASCCIFALYLSERDRLDPRVEAILDDNASARQSVDSAASRPTDREQVAPLVAAAQEFAAYLNPPPPPVVAQTANLSLIQLAESKPSEPKQTARPAFSAVGFKLVATSYYEGRPDKSMALLWEPGNGDAGRWVGEGTQVGHFTVHEIRQGVVVLRDGTNTRELAVERATIQRNLVKEVRPGNSRVSAVIGDSNDQY